MKLLARRFLPYSAVKLLWGDRKRWGLEVDQTDPCWMEWVREYSNFYEQNQREGIGTKINDAGYSVMSKIDLTGKKVLEIGAGDIRHISHWNGIPDNYILADISKGMLAKAEAKLKKSNVNLQSILLERSQSLPVDDGVVDVIVTFYSLEHLYPLLPYIHEMKRVLKPGGIIMGAIPAEGGLAWGMGRALTSRRWFKKYTSIDPDKIICWEHPNFADHILTVMDSELERYQLTYWPFRLPLIDPNLIIQFIYKKAEK